MGFFDKKVWKIRERATMSLLLILEQKEIIQENIIEDMKNQLVDRKRLETQVEIKLLITNENYIKQITGILKDNWENKSQ